jgi:hypothetical protein
MQTCADAGRVASGAGNASETFEGTASTGSWVWQGPLNGTGTFHITATGGVILGAGNVYTQGNCGAHGTTTRGRVIIFYEAQFWAAGSVVATNSGAVWDSGAVSCATTSTWPTWLISNPALTATSGKFSTTFAQSLTSSTYAVTLSIGCIMFANTAAAAGDTSLSWCEINPLTSSTQTHMDTAIVT